MLNKKFLIMLLSCSCFVLIYLVNQHAFLKLLNDPSDSKYSQINQNFNAYLVADNVEYQSTAQTIDKQTDTCVIFVDAFSKKGMYTNECSNAPKYISESSYQAEGISYDSIYEYLYSVSELTAMDQLSYENYLRYNQIISRDSLDLKTFLPDNVNYAAEDYLYTTYSPEYTSGLMNKQLVLLNTVVLGLFLIFIFGYIRSKQKVYAIYELLGKNQIEIFKYIVIDYLNMLTKSYVIALICYFVITISNGNLYYLAMYFEYFNLSSSIYLYILLVMIIIPISLILYGLLITIPLEKRLK